MVHSLRVSTAPLASSALDLFSKNLEILSKYWRTWPDVGVGSDTVTHQQKEINLGFIRKRKMILLKPSNNPGRGTVKVQARLQVTQLQVTKGDSAASDGGLSADVQSVTLLVTERNRCFLSRSVFYSLKKKSCCMGVNYIGKKGIGDQ